MKVTFRWEAGSLTTPCLHVIAGDSLLFKGTMLKRNRNVGFESDSDDDDGVYFELQLVSADSF